MAALTVMPQTRPRQKPGRSMTHPLREGKSGGTRQRKKESEQFDPEELRRKLEAHLAEERKRTEQRRAKTSTQKPNTYHHVPRVAASDFERTATPELMGQKDKSKRYVHKLAQAALKHYADEAALPQNGSFDLRKTQAMDQVRKQRDLVRDRNQFQRTRDLEHAAQFDRERNLNKVPQRTFATDYLDVKQQASSSRPLSTGDLPWEEDIDSINPASLGKPDLKSLLMDTANDRQDWEQRDEIACESHRSVKERVTPFLRRPDMVWMSRSKKDSKAQESVARTSQVPTSGEIKQKKSIFLGLFKR